MARSVDRRLRSDAERNRQLIVTAAALACAERGLDAGYDEIARRAGVGVGTVYRRFPERADLIAALFDTQVDDLVALAAEAGHIREASKGLRWFVERVIEVAVANHGLQQVLAGNFDHHGQLAPLRTKLGAAVQTLLSRAQADGSIRPDVVVADIRTLIKSISPISTEAHPDLWRRYLILAFDGLATKRSEPTPLVVAPASDGDLDELHQHFQAPASSPQ